MIAALVIMPFCAGLMAFFLRRRRLRQALLLGTALSHTLLTCWCWLIRVPPRAGAWIGLDAAGMLFLSILSGLFLLAACYAIGYLRRERAAEHQDFEEGFVFANQPEAIFTGCLLLFLGTMSWVCISRHLGLLWVAVEATTLASAPLIYFHRHHRSLEATWKYLLICSVGIALALLGTFFLGVAATGADGHTLPLTIDNLLQHGGRLQPVWLRAAFIFLLVGYGTKMGLAPLHTWLPDAHSEAPSVVSALLSGAVLNCAFLALVRVHGLCVAAGEGAFSGGLLIAFGLLSMAVAAVLVIGQRDFKRLLAYSSVEHMGILAFGLGLRGIGAFGAMLHALNHSVVKALLFFVAGNIIAQFQTKSINAVRGMLPVMPLAAALWLAGLLAIAGMPPFGVFLSKFTIVNAAIVTGHPWCGVLFLVLLAVMFFVVTRTAVSMALGAPSPPEPVPKTMLTTLPPLVLCGVTLVLGLWVPAPLQRLLQAAAAIAGGTP
jgi:hydrogenase-4 component F